MSIINSYSQTSKNLSQRNSLPIQHIHSRSMMGKLSYFCGRHCVPNIQAQARRCLSDHLRNFQGLSTSVDRYNGIHIDITSDGSNLDPAEFDSFLEGKSCCKLSVLY